MSGDYTRFTFNPRHRFSAMHMQQGRVQLDADWNESADILRERTRVLGLDLFGPAAISHLTTPDAFRIGLVAGPPPDLSLGPGRAYVDGRLAEIFPDEGVTYLHQPFLPDPPAFDPAVDCIVYLDLWEREVTYIEQPALLDVALGGVDTTTRVQQVWQVRVLERPDAVCGVDLDALFPPSAARLTTFANAPPAPDDPCILPPYAGYRGLENRLYRVEVHRGGPLGTALFKYSRDNGSIVSRVTAIAVAGPQTRLTVNRIGRDVTLRFRIDDWVTLTDDYREFHGEEGQMARIVDIDEAARQIVLDRIVPTAGRAFGANPAEIVARNTRLQRWDQRTPLNALDADGLIATATGPINLEDGIQLTFSADPTGADFRIGDYWVFAARTADASVEILDQAPPRGIRHQYVQLAAIPAGGTPQDCRPPAQGKECCCTFVVPPGEDIQAAIDALPPPGGCVCLLPGIHPIRQGLRIARSNVTLKCESDGAIVRLATGDPLLQIGSPAGALVEGVLVSRIEFEREFREGGILSLITIASALDSAIEDCELRALGQQGVGIFLSQSRRFRIERCSISSVQIGIVADGRATGDLVLADNRIDLSPPRQGEPGLVGILASGTLGPCSIRDNFISGGLSGIIINDQPIGVPEAIAEGVSITGNRIVCAEAAPGFSPSLLPRIGIDLAARGSLAANNTITLFPRGGGTLIGIRLTSTNLMAADNLISLNGEGPDPTTGIQVGYSDQNGTAFTSGVTVVGNGIALYRSGIAATDAWRLDVNGNRIETRAERNENSVGIGLTRVVAGQIRANIIEDYVFGITSTGGRLNGFTDNSLRGGTAGFFVSQEAAPMIVQNRVNGAGTAGIAAFGVSGRCDMNENRVTACGFRNQTGFGLIAFQIQGELLVKANEIMNIGLAPEGGVTAAVTAIGISGVSVLEAAIEGNLVTYSSPTSRPVAAEDRALLLQGLLETEIVTGQGVQVLGFPIVVTNNKFIGAGRSALVELRQTIVSSTIWNRFERVFFSNNYCMHVSSEPADHLATVMLVGRAAAVIGNQVKATTPFFSFHFNGMPGPYIGNITGGGVLQHPVFPAPETGFNMQM